MMGAWRLDESAHAGHEHLDEEYVAGYERKAGFDPADDIAELQRYGLGPDAVVVDLGAGTGVFAEAAARTGAHVTAVDVSPVMVAALRARVATAHLDRVTVAPGGFLSYEHRGAPADIVFTRHALHQIPDFWKAVALSRIAAMLRPGGILRVLDLIYDAEPADVPTLVEDWIARATDDARRGWTAAELAEHVRTEHGTFRWLFEPMLLHAGFEILDVRFHSNLYGAYTCRRSSPPNLSAPTGHAPTGTSPVDE